VPENLLNEVRSFQEGSLVGNGGHIEGLLYTSTTAKSLFYLNENYGQQEDCKRDRCISKTDIKALDKALLEVRVYSVNTKLCENGNDDCSFQDSLASKAYPRENKIYINSEKWAALNQEQKVIEALMGYLAFISDEEMNGRLETLFKMMKQEVYEQLFVVDYMVDHFMDFLIKRGIKVRSIGQYDQEKFKQTANLAMECLLLAEKRFPGRVDLEAISLENEYHEFTDIFEPYFIVNQVRIGYYNDHINGEYLKKINIGRNANLQKCYNVITLKGLSEIASVAETDIETDSYKLPKNMDRFNFELARVANKAIPFVLENHMVFTVTKPCGEAGANCVSALFSKDDIEAIKTSYLKTSLSFTNKRLCAQDGEDCIEVTAINNPKNNSIVVNKKRWGRLETEEKVQVIIHEYFGIAGLEVNNYYYSSQITPLVYLESFHFNFYSSDARDFIDEKNLKVRYAGGHMDQKSFNSQLGTVLDCLKLVDSRFPGKLAIEAISLVSEKWLGDNRYCDKYDIGLRGWCFSAFEQHNDIYSPEYLPGVYLPEAYAGKDRSSAVTVNHSWLGTLTDHADDHTLLTLYVGGKATLQQCYNQVVSKGLK
jgi:hypothetical protein